MARISKTSHLDNYNDHDPDLQTPDSTYHSSFDEAIVKHEPVNDKAHAGGLGVGDGFVTESEEEMESGSGMEGDGHQRRMVSNMTRTSVSSMPDSTYPTDHERGLPQMHSPYTPSRLRPSLRRANMTTPSPFTARSTRESLRGRGSKNITPRSDAKGSPQVRREEENKRFPLVLLHVTLLPINLPWPLETMRALLPQHVLRDVQLLRCKASETLLKRGILIPHPEDDYDLLEERLLEALELQEGRISKCGHFRGKSSTSSATTFRSEDEDSALGSDESADGDLCPTCEHHVTAGSTREQRWSVRVYAANGLMRGNTWAAAWNEMERVDVEIMPWMSDDLRMSLDEKVAEQEQQHFGNLPQDMGSSSELAYDKVPPSEPNEEAIRSSPATQSSAVVPSRHKALSTTQKPVRRSDVPNIYRPRDIPLSILLRNYFLLLLQDRRIVAALFAGLIGLFVLMQPANTFFIHPNPGILRLPEIGDSGNLDSFAESILATGNAQAIEVATNVHHSEDQAAMLGSLDSSTVFLNDSESQPTESDQLSMPDDEETRTEKAHRHPHSVQGSMVKIPEHASNLSDWAEHLRTSHPMRSHLLEDILQICAAGDEMRYDFQ